MATFRSLSVDRIYRWQPLPTSPTAYSDPPIAIDVMLE
jgi:hypothetical protein